MFFYKLNFRSKLSTTKYFTANKDMYDIHEVQLEFRIRKMQIVFKRKTFQV